MSTLTRREIIAEVARDEGANMGVEAHSSYYAEWATAYNREQTTLDFEAWLDLPENQLTRPDEPARAVETYRKFLAEEVFDWVGYLARYEQDCEQDRANGHRPHYCIHGTNMWVDWDCACGPCEDGLTAWDMAERSAWSRHTRYLHVLDQMATVVRSHERQAVPTYLTDAYVQWLTEVSPAVSPTNTKEN